MAPMDGQEGVCIYVFQAAKGGCRSTARLESLLDNAVLQSRKCKATLGADRWPLGLCLPWS